MEEPLFSEGWSGHDEVNLLNAIEEHGYGNWTDIGQRVHKPSEECISHYHRYYMIQSNPYLLHSIRSQKDIKTSLNNNRSCDTSHDENELPQNYPGQEIYHYNPWRQEFDIECYDNAEKLLALATGAYEEVIEDHYTESDRKLVRQMTLSLIDSYRVILTERERRKNVIKEHSLIDIYRIISKESLLPPVERFIRHKLRLFMRFVDMETSEKLTQSLLYEEKLIDRIKRLQSYRTQGIKSSQSAKVYEKLLEKRTLMKAKKIKAFEEIRKANKVNGNNGNWNGTNNVQIMSTLQDSNITNSKTSSATTARPKQTTAPLNITYSPGVDLLHDEEKENQIFVNSLLFDSDMHSPSDITRCLFTLQECHDNRKQEVRFLEADGRQETLSYRCKQNS